MRKERKVAQDCAARTGKGENFPMICNTRESVTIGPPAGLRPAGGPILIIPDYQEADPGTKRESTKKTANQTEPLNWARIGREKP